MRYFKPYFIAGILTLILIGQGNYLASGQTQTIADHVVINEVEISPQGDDSTFPLQWVELYNPTDLPVNIGGWQIGATTGLKNILTIPVAGNFLGSQKFVVFYYQPLWFPHIGSQVQLKNQNGSIIDQTPYLSDQNGDSNTWQRIYDGYGTAGNPPSDWIFKLATPGSSNGNPPTSTVSSQFSMSVSTDKQSYIFGDTAIISGYVSSPIPTQSVGSIPLNLILSGANGFHRTFLLYPGNDLKFSTHVKLDQDLGFTEGSYSISASYGDAKASSSFLLESQSFVQPAQAAPTTLYINTDKPTYTISEAITLQGNVSKVIQFTPVTYKVYDPNGAPVYQGTLFPDSKGQISSSNQYQQQASTSGILVNRVNPVYGIYSIVATYSDQTSHSGFVLTPESVQNSDISLSTDKPAYGLGDDVLVTGRVNKAWVSSVNLQIVQSFSSGPVAQTFDTRTLVEVAGDSTFSYKFSIPVKTDRLGSYRVTVSTSYGAANSYFVVAENPISYQSGSSSPLSLVTDKESYGLGEQMVISGKVSPTTTPSVISGVSVKILVTNATGAPIISAANAGPNLSGAGTGVVSSPLAYYAYPDSNGNFQVTETVSRSVFQKGNYSLTATYGPLSATTRYNVYDSLDTGSQGIIVASTDKKVYGVGETVQLNGKISGLSDTSSFTLILVKPDGEQITSPLLINNGVFSWRWVIPASATTGISPITADRSSSPVLNSTLNVYGIYKITINSQSVTSDLFFQVSQNPTANQDLSPIVVQTDKTDYISTDVAKISGQVIPVQNAATQVANTMVQIIIFSDTGQQSFRTDVNVDQGGQFRTSIPFHPGIWKTGNYRLYAQYLTSKAQSSFKVIDPYTTSSDKLQVFMTTDHEKYLPGQKVLVTGRTSYIVSINDVDLTFGLKDNMIISEGQIMSKKGDVLPKVTVSFDQTGSFSYDYSIPGNTPLGNYTIIAQVPFGAYSTFFEVVSQLPAENLSNGANTNQTNNNETLAEPTSVPTTIGPISNSPSSANIVERIGKISDSNIQMEIGAKTIGNTTYYPMQLDGLLRVNPGNENDVNIKVSTPDGTCVIGPDQDCKVTQSTIRNGSLYQIVDLNSVNFLVGYSGSGMRIEQFSILPAITNEAISDGKWNVEIIKKDEITRFYYHITYMNK